MKRTVFAELNRLCPPRAILATNLSTFVSSLVADATKRPAQVANLHYFKPAMVMEVVEVVQGPQTSAEAATFLVAARIAISRSADLIFGRRPRR